MKQRLTRDELRVLLGVADEIPEPVVRLADPVAPALDADELFVVWSAARAEANIAYDAWCASPGIRGYAAYRAAEDRADAAETALARASAVPV